MASVETADERQEPGRNLIEKGRSAYVIDALKRQRHLEARGEHRVLNDKVVVLKACQVMQIYRAEDGEAFQINKTLRDIEKSASLEAFLHEVTGVDEAAVLAYLSDGRRLREENLRELAGAVDQSIFVFNKHYLDYELEDILLKLRVTPPLHPEVEGGDPAHIDTFATADISHYDFVVHIFNTIHVQHEALRIASTSLDLNVLSISDAFEAFAGGGRRELEKQAHLLQGLEFDLEITAKIRIHPEFLSPAVRKAVEAGEKARTLGDYVSNVKMRQVGDACAKTHNELRGRFNTADDSVARLTSGADEVRSSIVNSGLVEEAELCMKRSQEALERITEIRAHLQEPRTDEVELLAELRKEDVAIRDEVQLIADIKNKSTALCMRALRHVSHLNNDLVVLPQLLSSLQSDFRAKTNFAHIQRLHNMLYAYGATLVEIVRRKEFSRFFSQRAQTIAEIMAKLSSSERKRRQIYRGEVHGQLPFDTKGMDDSVPSIEITSTGSSNNNYSVERDDLVALLDELDQIDQSHGIGDQNGDFEHTPLKETRSALEKLINRMDNLEATFDKMAEKTIFSASRIALPRRQATDHTDTEFQEIVEQLHELQDVKGEQERQFEKDRRILQVEIDHLHMELHEAHEWTSQEKQRTIQLEDDLRHQQTQNESERSARDMLQDRQTELLAEIEDQRKALSEATVTITEQLQVSDALRREVVKVTADLQEAERLEMEASEHVMKLISEKELLSHRMEQIQAREKDLETQVKIVREETKEINRAYEDKERRLRAQVLDADRALRDVIAEADGDRAVLEHQCSDMKATLEATERQLKESKAELEVSNADVAGLKEELQRTEHELQETRHVEAGLRNDLHSAQDAHSGCHLRLQDSEQLAEGLLRVATGFRDSQCKAFAVAQASSSSSKSVANLADSTISLKPFVEPPLIDPKDLAGGLRVLSEYDLTAFNDAIAKTGSTIRKWQKQCKEYRDRAKGKISFRNFSKGDLALFLPTRNSISKPWAAFNVSFPHYFLQATGNLAEQLKTREWIVARITSITEQMAAVRDPSSNPYGLADGTKFYMLQVEDWTQSSPRRKTSPPKPMVTETVPDTHTTQGPEAAGLLVDASTSTLTSVPKLESPVPTPRHLLGPRQRTHSAPSPQPSSLSRLLAQGTPPIEEVTENSSPSPPRLPHSRPSSPLAGLSQTRPTSSLVSPPHSRPSSPLASPPLSRPLPSSPLVEPSRSHPSSPPTGPPHARPSPPLSSSSGRPVSPLARTSYPRSPSPLVGPLSGPSPVQPSPKSTTSPVHLGSRRSSSSSRPSTSSIFSTGRHPFTLSSSPAKAAPTTALSDPSVSLPIAGALSNGSREEVTASDRAPATPSPEGSPSEGMSSILLARRRTTSASTHGYTRSSLLSASPNDRPHSSQSQGALATLASSWGFGKKGGSVRRPIGGETPSSSPNHGAETGGVSSTVGRTTRSQKPAASEILRRYDDILPLERGPR